MIKDWVEMDENYEFCFCLYPNDLVEIQSSKMQKPVLGLYKSSNASKASISMEHLSHYMLNEDELNFYKNEENKFIIESLGVKTLKVFRKKTISVLGEVKDAPKCKREGVGNKS